MSGIVCGPRHRVHNESCNAVASSPTKGTMDDSTDFEVTLTEPRLLRAMVLVLKVLAVLYLGLAIYGVVAAYGQQSNVYRDYLLMRPALKGPNLVPEPSLLPLLPQLVRGVLTSLVVFAGGEIIRLLLGLRAVALKTRHELGELAAQVQYRTRPPS